MSEAGTTAKQVSIREATAADAAAIADLHIASWRDAYRGILSPDYLAGPIEAERHAYWSGLMEEPKRHQRVLIAEDGGTPIGFICTFGDDDPTWGSFVNNLHVLAGHRGGGTGTGLLRATARWLAAAASSPALYLWVYEANRPARHFYEGLGAVAVEALSEPIPGGGFATAIRMHWPDARTLLESEGAAPSPPLSGR
jgi:GNAT superfamily N-acetyltransferase